MKEKERVLRLSSRQRVVETLLTQVPNQRQKPQRMPHSQPAASSFSLSSTSLPSLILSPPSYPPWPLYLPLSHLH
jgi:hypothetical protein